MDFRGTPLLLPILFYVALLALLLWPGNVSSVQLCGEGDCNHNTLDICEPFEPDRTVLPVMGLFPCNTGAFRARGLTVAAQMAVRALLRNDTILPGYRIELIVSNTMCDRVAGVRSFIDQLLQNDTKYMIIGPGCSTGAVRIAEIAPFYNITQISYTAASITLSDKQRFPNFFRTISSDNASITSFEAIIREYGWQQVAIVSEINELFINLTLAMHQALEKEGVRVLTERLAFTRGADSTSDIVEQLNTTGARIVILNVFEDLGREIFCAAYKRGMVFPHYVFMSYFWYTEFWWRDPILPNPSYSYTPEICSVSELLDAIRDSIALGYFPVAAPGEEDAPTDVGYTPNQFWTEFTGNIVALGYPSTDAIRQAWYAYDAVWAAALALDRASRELREQDISLEDYDYNRSDINDVILRNARELVFQGVSGRVVFNEHGDREPTVQFYQYRSNDTLPDIFARFDPNTGVFTYLKDESSSTVFPGGVPVVVEEVFVHPALFGLYTALSCLGIIFATVCLVFNLIFKDKRIVKLSSPYLNVLIIVGIIFSFVVVILFGIDENTASFDIVDALCQARIWVAAIGFSLLFGTMLAKTWRVYYIFRSVKRKKKPLKDWILFLVVAVLVAIDVVFLTIVTFWRLRLKRELVPREGGEIPEVFDTCTSDASKYWIPVLLSYKAVFLLVGLFPAVQTYNVKIKELRDSKLIVASVAGIAVVSVVITVPAFLLDNKPNATYAIIGFFIMLLLTSVLILLFVTRMIELYQNPSGEVKLPTFPSQECPSTQPPNTNVSSEDSTKIAGLKETIRSLKAEIEALKASSKTPGPDIIDSVSSKANLMDTDSIVITFTEESSTTGDGEEEGIAAVADRGDMGRKEEGAVKLNMQDRGRSTAGQLLQQGGQFELHEIDLRS